MRSQNGKTRHKRQCLRFDVLSRDRRNTAQIKNRLKPGRRERARSDKRVLRANRAEPGQAANVKLVPSLCVYYLYSHNDSIS